MMSREKRSVVWQSFLPFDGHVIMTANGIIK